MLIFRFCVQNVALLLQMGGVKPVFRERSRARRRGWPGRCFWGAAGAICVAILAFALPGGEALKYTDAGARANHAADGATEGGDGSDESDNPHAGKDLAVKREAIKSVLRATCMLSRGIRAPASRAESTHRTPPRPTRPLRAPKVGRPENLRFQQTHPAPFGQIPVATRLDGRV